MSVCERCIIGKCDGWFECDWCRELYPEDEKSTVDSRGMVICDECYAELEGEL